MSHPVDIHVGKKLKQARTLRRLSQTDVARKLGLSFQQIQKYEIGSNRIAASRLFELSQVLEVPTSFFFEGLHDNANEAPSSDPAMQIVNAIAAIPPCVSFLKIRRICAISSQGTRNDQVRRAIIEQNDAVKRMFIVLQLRRRYPNANR